MQQDIAVSQHNIRLHLVTQIECSTVKKKNLMNKIGTYLSVFLLIRLHFVFPS